MADKEHPAAKAGRFVRAVGKATAAARESSAQARGAPPAGPPPPAAQGDAVPVPKEHPAAKAGRYVRAAGIVIGKEVDRRAAAAAARPAPPPPPPPAAVRTGGFFGTMVFRFFVLALVVLVLTLLRAPDAVPSHERTIVRLVFAAILALQAFLLISNWHLANQRIGQRLLTRMWGARGPMNRRERGFARTTRDVLILIGIGFLAAAVFQLLVAAGVGPG